MIWCFIRCRTRGCDSGGVAIEFALVMPVFILLLYGVLEFGRAIWAQNTLEFAVGEAARFAIVNTTATSNDIANVARDNVIQLDTTQITFTVNIETSGATRSFVRVQADYPFTPLIPLSNLAAFNIRSSSRVPVVQ